MISTRFLNKIAIIFLLFLMVPLLSGAATPDPEALTPQLGEIQSFFQAPALAASTQAVPGEPAWLPEARKETQGFVLQQKVRSLPGARAYNLNNPPVRHYWWNYPVYAVVGFPRDLVDGLFGLTSNVPIINIATTGAMYEIVPTQVLTRNWHDWHTWPFYSKINKNGHGWLDGKWGYFSNRHHTRFTAPNEEKLAEWRKHNAFIDQQLAGVNSKVEQANSEITAKRQQYLQETRQLFNAGKHRDVIHRLVPYREIDPLNREARTMLAVSLIHDLGEIPERQWADQMLTDLLWSSSREVLIPVKDEIKNSKLAGEESISRYLVAIDMRLGNYAQAYSTAQNLVAENPTNVTYMRMQYEAALAAKDANLMAQSVEQIEKTAGADSIPALHARGRMAFAQNQPGQALAIYQRLAKMQRGNARFQYLLGLAYVEQGKATRHYDKEAAREALAKAVDLAQDPEEKSLYQEAYEAAGQLRVK